MLTTNKKPTELNWIKQRYNELLDRLDNDAYSQLQKLAFQSEMRQIDNRRTELHLQTIGDEKKTKCALRAEKQKKIEEHEEQK